MKNGRLHGAINTVVIEKEKYRIESVEFEDERFFFLKNCSDEIICMIMQNEKCEWEADCDISPKLFEETMKWVNKLYLEK
jgi:hypothetical protein